MIKLFLDCGSVSIYNALSREPLQNSWANAVRMGTPMSKRHLDNFDYVDTDDYREYRDSYIETLLEKGHLYDVYPNLDVINHGELSWENQQILESHGLNPIPVWHFGTDLKWLELYLDKGYEYIAMGGLTPNSYETLKPGLDRIWAKYLTDEEGLPLVKVHGFALTSFKLMVRYPWYSVDSKSWLDRSRFGKIMVPRIQSDGSYDYAYPSQPFISNRAYTPERQRTGDHYLCMIPAAQEKILEYLDRLGVKYGESEYKKEGQDYKLESNEAWFTKPTDDEKGLVEIIVEEGVSNSYRPRTRVNSHYFHEVENVVPDWPWKFKHKSQGLEKGLF